MNKTGIEWCDFTWNPLIGCSKTSEGCVNCYAETMALRLANMWHKSRVKGTEKYTKVVYENSRTGRSGWNGNIVLDKGKLLAPSKRKKSAKIFVGSMTDLFHENTKWCDIDEVIKVIINNPQHTFQILTKRPKNMKEYFDVFFKENKINISNLWVGVSIENQKEANERIPLLSDIKANIRFLSVEPLLEGVNLHGISNIKWVIVGGETGKNARFLNRRWVRNIYHDCKATNTATAFFFKQRGSNHNFKETLEFETVKEFPNEI